MTPPRLAAGLFLLIALALTGCGLGKVDLVSVATSGRDGWQHPERVIEVLQIQPGDVVAEIGAGREGYWIPWLSDAVGAGGVVYAVEVDDEAVDGLRALVAEQGLDNVRVVLGEYADPLLPDHEVDLAITSLTYHHIEDRSAYFARLRSDLSPRGRVAHLDDRDDLPAPLRWLATKGHWSNVEAMKAEMTSAGYRRTQSFDFLLTQSFQVFVPDATVAAGRD